nr:unnamed protein product [Spirometra erinaceieuropaei]
MSSEEESPKKKRPRRSARNPYDDDMWENELNLSTTSHSQSENSESSSTLPLVASPKSKGETTPSVHLLAPNSHLWLHVAGLCSAATPRATVSTGGLNQVRALCTCAECTPYRGLPWTDGLMKHCAGIVETRLCLVRRWITAAGTGLCIAFAETRPPSPTETADSRHMRSFSTTNIKVVAP